MKTLVFTCPVRNQQVQHWIADADHRTGDDAYVSVSCQACARLHFLNLKTGKLLGEKSPRRTDGTRGQSAPATFRPDRTRKVRRERWQSKVDKAPSQDAAAAGLRRFPCRPLSERRNVRNLRRVSEIVARKANRPAERAQGPTRFSPGVPPRRGDLWPAQRSRNLSITERAAPVSSCAVKTTSP